ncbi:penicillin acylase family protein [Kutzneria sp. NPDC051319]|uniref:penicillin acylase family protein n=1 Tax=Kutzneria sp. NPDC051319 TaxID=3155047 RepID=UPI00342FCC61
MRVLRLVLAASLVLGLAAPAAAVGTGQAATIYSASVRRTEHGIPHILARDIGSAGYGYGYAFAQDNLCALEEIMMTANGDRSRWFGPDADAGDLSYGPLTNLASDTFVRSVLNNGFLRRVMDQPAPLGLDAETRRLIDGYVAGVNRHMAETAAPCHGARWVRPVTSDDITQMGFLFSQFGGLHEFQRAIADAKPAGSTAAAIPHPRSGEEGSNGVAIGARGVVGGDGSALLANPHFPWLGGDRMYQVQLTVPGVMDVSGASIYGTPFVVIGHTQHLAWTHTVSTAQRFTLYELHLVPGDPTSYLVDGRPERMTETDVIVPTGPASSVTTKVYRSRYGPVLADGWTATHAVAVRGASADNGRAFNEWVSLDQDDSVAELRETQNRYQGVPFVNTIAADATGVAYFADASAVPHVTDEQAARCVDTPEAKALYPNEIELDGSTSDCAWGSDPDAVVPGIFGPSRYPTLSRADFVTNSNDSSWLTNPAAPITSLPAIYGPVGTKRLPRTQLGLEQIQDRIGTGFTLANMDELLTAERNWSADRARDATVTMCRHDPLLMSGDGREVDVSAGCSALAAWSGRNSVGDRGAVLWREFWLRAARVPEVWSVPFDPSRPVSTPNTLDTDSPGVRQALADAVLRLAQLHVPVDAPLSAAQYTTVGGGELPVPGCGNVEGCYDITAATDSGLLGDGGRFGAVTMGSSFVMAVRLTRDGPKARTLLTYSESSDPSSPHHGDQTVLYGRGGWVPDRFSEAEITASPELSVSVLCGRGA